MYPRRNKFEMAAHDSQFSPVEEMEDVNQLLSNIKTLADDLKKLSAKPMFREDGKLNV